MVKSAIETESGYRNLVHKPQRKLGQDSTQTLPGIGIRVVVQ